MFQINGDLDIDNRLSLSCSLDLLVNVISVKQIYIEKSETAIGCLPQHSIFVVILLNLSMILCSVPWCISAVIGFGTREALKFDIFTPVLRNKVYHCSPVMGCGTREALLRSSGLITNHTSPWVLTTQCFPVTNIFLRRDLISRVQIGCKSQVVQRPDYQLICVPLSAQHSPGNLPRLVLS